MGEADAPTITSLMKRDDSAKGELNLIRTKPNIGLSCYSLIPLERVSIDALHTGFGDLHRPDALFVAELLSTCRL